jgi:hypothetical protein
MFEMTCSETYQCLACNLAIELQDIYIFKKFSLGRHGSIPFKEILTQNPKYVTNKATILWMKGGGAEAEHCRVSSCLPSRP